MSLERAQWVLADIELYRKLFYQKLDRELTPQEKEFCRDMYWFEKNQDLRYER